MNLYRKILIRGSDGRLHLPALMSPEYGVAKDNNYNLALLRWACQTLLDLNRRYQLHDPLATEWEAKLSLPKRQGWTIDVKTGETTLMAQKP